MFIPDEFVSVMYSGTTDNGGDQTLAHEEPLAYMMQLLEGHKVKRRINIRFLNEGTILHENYGGIFLYFRDENGKKTDTDYIIYLEDRCKARDWGGK